MGRMGPARNEVMAAASLSGKTNGKGPFGIWWFLVAGATRPLTMVATTAASTNWLTHGRGYRDLLFGGALFRAGAGGRGAVMPPSGRLGCGVERRKFLALVLFVMRPPVMMDLDFIGFAVGAGTLRTLRRHGKRPETTKEDSACQQQNKAFHQRGPLSISDMPRRC